jgi:hypothetical protein
MDNYTSAWRCARCETQNTLRLSKIEAAFFDCEKYKKKRSPCVNCGSLEAKSSSQAIVDIDRDLLEIWITDNEAFFMSQDEVLLIADTESSIIFDFLEYPNISESKKLSLIEALIVRLTDSLASTPNETKEISSFLESKRSEWDGRKEIWPYLQDRARMALKA